MFLSNKVTGSEWMYETCVSQEVLITIQKPGAHLHVCSDMRVALSRVNAQKAAGPDGVPGRVLRACVVQLTEARTDISTCH